ncbi:MAG: hypothetical protein A2163_00680 [Actinobacteria bacterium RBG_13_35_12]|nr:MAG: hypothetical protein A2163_00680 [Actinobacteria bacterium RBG_13_35_12]
MTRCKLQAILQNKRKGMIKIKITSTEFTKMYYENTNEALSKKYGVSTKTIVSYARKLGLRKMEARSLGPKPKLEIIIDK